ncbi:Uncharacterized protein HZ326_16428 [Fusarium oxysporum f. sp. albedinis]|nr:Uncharacterized protein HZ326_16428 [Fusarium oxysporum f. sp. albedinis]
MAIPRWALFVIARPQPPATIHSRQSDRLRLNWCLLDRCLMLYHTQNPCQRYKRGSQSSAAFLPHSTC